MDIDELIARRLAALRKERELTLAQLAERCAVSKAMISRIERNQSSPTASVLGRLAGGLGVALSELLGDAQAPAEPLCRRAQQEVWEDPARGGRRVAGGTTARRNPPAAHPRPATGAAGRAGRPSGDSRGGRSPGSPLPPSRSRCADRERRPGGGGSLDFGVDRAVTFATAGQACRYLLVILHD
ncbi:helix-turn-helix domain-containing protein [Pseudomonas aeruginosa]|nr:helix-turn-helix domain-containing protein [Pseudomonas aeruginosa]